MTNIKQFEPLWGIWRSEGKPIGEGSFGVVYRVVREEFGKKYYAAVKHISIPSSESQINDAISEGIAEDEESLKEYFESIAQNLVNEIALMNQVKGHTNIVSYEDHLIVPKESGIGYDILIRMELLTGLNDVLRRRQLTNSDVINLGIDICSALEVCVEKGIVHRDIKPSNIFVNDLGDYKLGDFGVARQLEHTTAGMSKKGTYIYMAPEVYRGEPANFTADIYSLGIVMYRLLNGNRAPFLPVGSVKIRPNDSEAALARRIAGEPLPAPAFAEEDLAEVVLKATQFDKSKRFANPTEFKAALQAVRDGVPMERTIPVVAAPTSNSSSENIRSSRIERELEARKAGGEKKAEAMEYTADATVLEEASVTVAEKPQKKAKTSVLNLLKKPGVKGWSIIGGGTALAAAAIAAAVFLSGNIVIGGQTFNKYATEIDLNNAGLTEYEALERCTLLKKLDLRGNTMSIEQYKALQAALPDCEIIWTVNIGGEKLDSDATRAELKDKGITDVSALETCTKLKYLDLRGNEISTAQFDSLQSALPDCEIIWTVDIGGVRVDSNAKDAGLNNSSINSLESLENLRYLTEMKSLDLTGCGFSDEELVKIRDDADDYAVIWTVDLYGRKFSSDVRNIDLSNVRITETGTLKKKAALFEDLRTVKMTGCGLSDEELYRLNQEMGEVSIIWSINVLGQNVLNNSAAIDLSNTNIPSYDELIETLRDFPKLNFINLGEKHLDANTLKKFSDNLPGVKDILCNVTLGGQTFSTSVGSLDLMQSGLSDISVLRYCTNLEYLYLYGNGKLKDISPLAECKKLWSVDLENTGVTDFSPLAKLPGLNSVWVSTNNLEEVTCLTNVGSLDISPDTDNKPIDFTPILGMGNLKTLNLHRWRVDDVTPLTEMTQLEWIQFWYCPGLKDVSPLKQLDKLEYLGLSDENLNKITGLEELTNLKCLYLYGGRYNWDFFSSLPNLEEVSLDSTGIKDVSILGDHANLRELSLYDWNGGIDNVKGLETLTRLERLNLSGQRYDWKFLPSLNNLEDLYVCDCSIASVDAFCEMKNLDWLYFNSCKISEANQKKIKEALPRCEIYFE